MASLCNVYYIFELASLRVVLSIIIVRVCNGILMFVSYFKLIGIFAAGASVFDSYLLAEHAQV